jgi:predicted membrane channel-forming protein YqfA (hemolysin III family)
MHCTKSLTKFSWSTQNFHHPAVPRKVLVGGEHWLALVAAKPMLLSVPLSGLLWLLAGGVLYTVGVVFYAWKRVPYTLARSSEIPRVWKTQLEKPSSADNSAIKA